MRPLTLPPLTSTSNAISTSQKIKSLVNSLPYKKKKQEIVKVKVTTLREQISTLYGDIAHRQGIAVEKQLEMPS